MELNLDKSWKDKSALDPDGKPTTNDYFQIKGNFDISLEEIDKIREGLQWVVIKTRSENMDSHDEFVVKLCKKMRESLSKSSIQLREKFSDRPT